MSPSVRYENRFVSSGVCSKALTVSRVVPARDLYDKWMRNGYIIRDSYTLIVDFACLRLPCCKMDALLNVSFWN